MLVLDDAVSAEFNSSHQIYSTQGGSSKANNWELYACLSEPTPRNLSCHAIKLDSKARSALFELCAGQSKALHVGL